MRYDDYSDTVIEIQRYSDTDMGYRSVIEIQRYSDTDMGYRSVLEMDTYQLLRYRDTVIQI